MPMTLPGYFDPRELDQAPVPMAPEMPNLNVRQMRRNAFALNQFDKSRNRGMLGNSLRTAQMAGRNPLAGDLATGGYVTGRNLAYSADKRMNDANNADVSASKAQTNRVIALTPLETQRYGQQTGQMAELHGRNLGLMDNQIQTGRIQNEYLPHALSNQNNAGTIANYAATQGLKQNQETFDQQKWFLPYAPVAGMTKPTIAKDQDGNPMAFTDPTGQEVGGRIINAMPGAPLPPMPAPATPQVGKPKLPPGVVESNGGYVEQSTGKRLKIVNGTWQYAT